MEQFNELMTAFLEACNKLTEEAGRPLDLARIRRMNRGEREAHLNSARQRVITLEAEVARTWQRVEDYAREKLQLSDEG